jgi:hypothetical protein
MRHRLIAVVLGLAIIGTAQAKGRAIEGQVVDRNGQGLGMVSVSLAPGNVEIVTEPDGSFRIDYLRDARGERIKIGRRTEYQVVLFRVGWHEQQLAVSYRRGELSLAPITLQEDIIRVENSDENIDPGSHTDPAQNAGGSYEGE